MGALWWDADDCAKGGLGGGSSAIMITMPITYWIFVLLTVALLSFIGYGTYTTARLLRTWQPDYNLLLLPAETWLRLALIGLCLALGLLSGVSPQELGWVSTAWPTHVGWGIGWGSGLALFFYVTTRWVVGRGNGRFYSTVIIKAITPRNQRELGLVLLAMGPVVLLEELLFRSLLIGGLRPILPLPLLLIGWSVLFGLLHQPQGIWGMIGAGFAGLILGYLFMASGTLVLPVVTHYITNIVQVIQAMRAGYGVSPHGADTLPGAEEKW